MEHYQRSSAGKLQRSEFKCISTHLTIHGVAALFYHLIGRATVALLNLGASVYFILHTYCSFQNNHIYLNTVSHLSFISSF
jgi:hypothetical protein